MKKLQTQLMRVIILIILSNCLKAQNPQGSEVVTSISNLQRGWIVIGSSGVGIDGRWTVIDGGRYDKNQHVFVCYSIDDAINWKKIGYQEYGCNRCGLTPPGGISKGSCFEYEKITSKSVFEKPPQKETKQNKNVTQNNSSNPTKNPDPFANISIPKRNNVKVQQNTISDSKRNAINNRRNLRNGETPTPKKSNVTLDPFENYKEDYTVYYKYNTILNSSSKPTILYDAPIEKIVKINISNFDEFEKLSPITVYVYQNTKDSKTEFKKFRINSWENGITVKGFYVEIVCVRENSNVKIQYNIEDVN